jgi:exosome complex RNA-binding protein Csl4
MAGLISRDAAIDAIVSVTVFPDAEYIKNLCQNPANSEDWLGGVCDAINAVEDVDAVDAAPVIHGNWTRIHIKGKEYGKVYYQHENCAPLLFESPYHYCPHCGAKVDEQGKDVYIQDDGC